MDPIITLNLRGTKKQYYQSLLIKSPYFSCLLGESSFEKTNPRQDGSYFIDCDADTFENIISYLEVGQLKVWERYSREYIEAQFGKFGIEYNSKERLKNKVIDKIKEFFKNILSKLNKDDEITLKFLTTKTCETKYMFDSDINILTCVWSSATNTSLYRLKDWKTFEYEWNEHMTQKIIVRSLRYQQIGVKLISE